MIPSRTLAIVALTTTIVSCSAPKMPETAASETQVVIRIVATTTTYPLALDLLTTYNATVEPVRSSVQSANFVAARRNIMRDPSLYMMTNALPSDQDLWIAPIARDGIAIIVGDDVSVDHLSLDQLRAIYQGRITNWTQVGGTSGSIIVYSREEGSGTRLEFERMVMGSRPLNARARITVSSQQIVEQVQATPGSIGYVSSGYLQGRAHVLSVEGQYPDKAAIARDQYPLRTTIYLVGLTEPEPANRTVFGWMQSLPGQAVVAHSFVPMNTLINDDQAE
jgi:phosphate transport system substrate-binding protein